MAPDPRRRPEVPSKRTKRDPKRGPKPAPGRANARQKQPLVNRALRDLRLVEWYADGVPLPEMVRRDGRSRRTIEGILEAHREHGIIGGAALLKRDPVSTMKRMLERAELHYQLAFEAAMDAPVGSVMTRLNALKTMMEAQDRLIELCQHLGILPKQLGSFRHVIDIRTIGEQMVEMILALERGEKSPEEVTGFFRELMGYGAPAEIPETVDGTVEAA